MGDDNLAVKELVETIKTNPSFEDAKGLASILSQNYYAMGLKNFHKRKYKSALSSFSKTLDLNPVMLSSWVKLGETYAAMGLNSDARLAWLEGLKIDPVNEQLRKLLGFDDNKTIEENLYKKASTGIKKEIKSLEIKDLGKIGQESIKNAIYAVQDSRTSKGTRVSSAIKSVMALTRSLGTKIKEDGWRAKSIGGNLSVQYLCKQDRGGKFEAENFEWIVDPDTKQVTPSNENARLLISRW